MTKQSHAIVIGGSMAGMCAARILSDHFAKVTIVDRDHYPDGAFERSGVPQSRHVHVLLARGRLELENLFPGFEETVLSRGALNTDFGWDFAALRVNGWAPREVYGIKLLHASRVLLEAVVRELLRKRHANIGFIEGTRITGFIVNENHSRVLGVKTISSDDRATTGELRADLIVDASGRSSKAPSWLREIGLPAPEEIVVDSHSGYASRWFNAPTPERRPKEWWWKAAWVDPKVPENPYAGVLFPVENNRWVITVAGAGKHYPPTDEAGYTAILNNLRSPLIAEAIKLAEPISEVYAARSMANRWRRYDKWPARLDGFLATGDAACAFNPVYGQGMTTGALSALALRDVIVKYGLEHAELPRKFQSALADLQKAPWGMATGVDFTVPGVTGQRPLANRIIDPIFGTILQYSAEDPVVRMAVGRVLHMLRPPSDLFAPALLGRAALNVVRGVTRRKPPETSFSPMPPPQWANVTPA
ncbi:MAG TPA: FAD-dependent monooxygenase [Candidatus Binataceae bacterium]|nr:FAD-dependent monooxygenase [Candidatus Binataceae bacterium]